MAENQNIELVLHMVNKMCGELLDKGFEYYLVTACPTKAFNIGSTKGRHFLQDNKDVVQRFIKHCYGGAQAEDMVFITTSDAPLYNKGNKTVCTEDLNEHTQSMEDRCDDNIATQSAQISNIDCTVELTESTSEDLPTAKTVMMETMGLKEICEERAQRIVDESAASPGRPVRRRRCSVPVWQNLIPKSSKKVTANRIKNTVEGGNDRLKRKQKAGFEEEPKSKQETGLTCVSARQQRLSKRLKTLDCLTKDESPKTSDCGPTKDESPKTPDCRPTKDESPKTPDCRPTKDELPKTLDCHPTKDESPKMEPGVEIVSLKGRRCDVCGKHYSTPQNMRRHRVTHSNFKAYKCSFCSQRFHFVQYLREHVVGCLNNPQRVKYRNHDRIRPSPVMMKHLQIVQSPHEPNTFINLPCDISEEIPKVNAQEEIKNLTAENDAEEMLKQVSEPAVDLEEARQHHRETTKEFRLGIKSEDWQTADGQYKCNICDKVILNQYNLYRHLQTHTDCKRYKCIYCGRRFTLGQYLKDHVISCKNNKKRVTISTNRRRINRDLKQNIIILPSTVEEGTFVNAEKEEESWTVEEGEEFDVEYVKESQDEELYQCSEQEWTNYYAHRSNDGTGKRAFTLSPHLIEVFKTEKKLGDNRLKDNMLNPYHCTVCNERKFNRAETLRRHLWSHMDNAHKCVICGVNFRYQEYLKSHVLQLHFGIKRKRKSRAVKQLTRHKSSQKNSTNVESDDDKINKTNQGSSDVDDDDKINKTNQGSSDVDDDDKINKTNQGSSDVDDDDKTNKTNQGSSDVDDDDKINKTNQGSSDVDDDDKINKTNQGSSDLNCYQKPRTKQNRKSVGQLNNFQQRILFQCVECSNKFFKYENLLWHQYHTHGLASFTKCPVCDVGTANGSLLSHLVQHHQKVQQPKPVKVQQPVYKCSQCDQSFSRELTMLIHQQKHTANTHPDKGNQCPICNITFTTFGNMRRHFKVIHSDEKPFMCHLCGKSFKTNDSLKCHVKIHDREKHLKYRCKTCGKGFFRNRLLKEHETLHVPGATTCMCDVCGKRFRLKPNLSKHMKSVHNLERNHVCSMCGKAFKLKEQLKNHMRYHVIKEGKVEEVGNRYGKIYQCETCGKFCPSSYSLKIHQTSHSPSRPYSCQLCGRNFKVKSKIQRHLQTVHNTKKRLPRKQLKTEMDESNVAESIVEVIVNSEADLVDNTKMYSLLDRSYSSSTNHNDPTVIEEAVQGISGNQDYILQGVQEVEDQPGTYIVSDTSEQSFSLSVDEGPKTLIYYITTD